MSHSKERHEKICLNCKTALYGRYCHACGQENIEPKETVWGLISHFFYDITHFDGKFFKTTGQLIARPGLLPKDYIEGRRARYLHPIKMYVFSSAVFFLIFFSMFSVKHSGYEVSDRKIMSDSAVDKLNIVEQDALKDAKTAADSLFIKKQFGLIKGVASTVEAGDTVKVSNNISVWGLGDSRYASHEEYDAAQKKLPAGERDNWLERRMTYRNIELTKEYNGRKKELARAIFQKFVHSFPYLLFISLPLYALFLRLLYIRRRQFYYVDHGLFLIYLYIFTFLFLLLFFAIDKLEDAIGASWLNWLEAGLLLYGIYYAWRAMHKFYGQGKSKTLLKFALLNILSGISIIVLFAVFFFITVFQL